jgi:hypothetical protein
MRKPVAVLLAVLLAGSPGTLGTAPAHGTIQGTVTLAGRPLAGIDLVFLERETGAAYRAVSDAKGGFATDVGPGRYVVTTENRLGLVVGQAPAVVPVSAGRVASARVDLLALPSSYAQEPPGPPPSEPRPPVSLAATPQPPAGEPQSIQTGGPVPTTGTGAAINFNAVTCFVAGEFPLLDAGIEPAPSVARARIYFRAAQSSSFYFVEMTQETGRFLGKLPRPRVEASPITYYLQATTTEFEESQTSEIEAIVVEKREDCNNRPVAAFGPPGEVTVFSAATGASIAPVGFAAGGAALALGTIALIVGGAAAAGVVGGIIVNPQPTPVPTPTTEPTEIPTPLPTPIPTATPVTVVTP